MFGKKAEKKKEITLDDIVPLHPNDYPGKHLRDMLYARHESLHEIRSRSFSEGLEHEELV